MYLDSVKHRCIDCNDPLVGDLWPRYQQCFECWSKDVDNSF